MKYLHSVKKKKKSTDSLNHHLSPGPPEAATLPAHLLAPPLPLQPRLLTPALVYFSEPLSGPPISPLLKGSDVNTSPSKGESGSELRPLLWSSWGPSNWPGTDGFPYGSLCLEQPPPTSNTTPLHPLTQSPRISKALPHPLSLHHKVLFLHHVIFSSNIYDRLSFYI